MRILRLPVRFVAPNNPQSWNQYSYVDDLPEEIIDDAVRVSRTKFPGSSADECSGVAVASSTSAPRDVIPLAFRPAWIDKKVLQAEFGVLPPPCDISGDALSAGDYAALGAEDGALFRFPGIASLPGSNIAGQFHVIGDLLAFHRGGILDAQAFGGSTPYGNYVFGVYMAATGVSLQNALRGANFYGSLFSHYSPLRAMDQDYPGLPAQNVADITSGYNSLLPGGVCLPR